MPLVVNGTSITTSSILLWKMMQELGRPTYPYISGYCLGQVLYIPLALTNTDLSHRPDQYLTLNELAKEFTLSIAKQAVVTAQGMRPKSK